MIQFLLLLILFSSAIISQDAEQRTILEFSGSFRMRAFNMGRDYPLSRKNSILPIYDKQAENNAKSEAAQNAFNEELDAKLKGNPSTITKQSESMRYYDARALLNLNFITSRYLDGLWGIQVGDIPFGGRGSGTTRTEPTLIGSGSGGELGQPSGTNVQTNFLYINFKLPAQSFNIRTGIQLFSSAQGRVLYTNGAGVQFTKDIRNKNATLEGGWIRARDRSIVYPDGNGFNSKNYINTNIYFLKLKLNPFRSVKNELYSYFLSDTDRTDSAKETGFLFWHGLFNEFTFSRMSFSIHGILNTGTLKSANPYRDNLGSEIYTKYDRHKIKGGLFDIQFNYNYTDKITLGLIGIGTTGRPGYERDGVSASNRGNGYRTLSPGFAISNIGIDFTGGYALFSGKTMSGLIEYGAFSNILVYGPLQLTLGYYRLYASKSPEIENNRIFNLDAGKKTTNYMGHEYNFNVRWNVFRDLQLLFRSGVFVAGDGLKVLFDSQYGKRIYEAFFTLEHKF